MKHLEYRSGQLCPVGCSLTLAEAIRDSLAHYCPEAAAEFADLLDDGRVRILGGPTISALPATNGAAVVATPIRPGVLQVAMECSLRSDRIRTPEEIAALACCTVTEAEAAVDFVRTLQVDE